MIRFSTLYETFDKAYPYTWDDEIKRDSRFIIGHFGSGKSAMQFRMIPNRMDGSYEVDFSTEKGASFKLTGDGDAFKILSTVIAMTKEAIAKLIADGAEVNKIFFSAEKTEDDKATGRADVYLKIAKKHFSSLGKITTRDLGNQLVIIIMVNK